MYPLNLLGLEKAERAPLLPSKLFFGTGVGDGTGKVLVEAYFSLRLPRANGVFELLNFKLFKIKRQRSP
jgi:hypothetical protein